MAVTKCICGHDKDSHVPEGRCMAARGECPCILYQFSESNTFGTKTANTKKSFRVKLSMVRRYMGKKMFSGAYGPEGETYKITLDVTAKSTDEAIINARMKAEGLVECQPNTEVKFFGQEVILLESP